MIFEKCDPSEATHVRILEENESNVTYGKVYDYLYDSSPSEQTHYIIQDNFVPFYDFECVMKVEYLKKCQAMNEEIDVKEPFKAEEEFIFGFDDDLVELIDWVFDNMREHSYNGHYKLKVVMEKHLYEEEED